MVVRDEDMTQRRQRQASADELSCYAVTTIDDVEAVADDNRLRARHRVDTRPRTAACAEEDETRLRRLRRLRAGVSHSRREHGGNQKCPASHPHCDVGQERQYRKKQKAVAITTARQ